jgi:hypothetical protein
MVDCRRARRICEQRELTRSSARTAKTGQMGGMEGISASRGTPQVTLNR